MERELWKSSVLGNTGFHSSTDHIFLLHSDSRLIRFVVILFVYNNNNNNKNDDDDDDDDDNDNDDNDESLHITLSAQLLRALYIGIYVYTK